MAKEEDISMIMDVIATMDRENAALLLQACENDPNKAVSTHFENPNFLENYKSKQIKETTWDEDVWSQDREGRNIASKFNIHGPDVTPTRPNSRTTNRSPIAHPVIDLSNDHANANPDQSRAWNSEEANVQRALALSLEEQESGVLQGSGPVPQDSGPQATQSDRTPAVIPTPKQYGPENRKSTPRPIGHGGITSSREIYVDPEPMDRQREADAPAFLKPFPDDARLGALLTIFHEIPILRAHLLDREHAPITYGYGYESEWWTGRKIEIPKLATASDLEGNELECVSQDHDLTEELQRIMAFLDITERSYGSAESFSQLLKRGANELDDDILLLFFQKSIRDDARKRLYSEAAQYASAPDENTIVDENGMERNEFMFLPMDQSCILKSDNLYDCLDIRFWQNGEPLEVHQTGYLERLGEVLIFKFAGKTSTKSIDFPLVFYPDRYLLPNREVVFETRKKQFEIKRKIAAMDSLTAKLTTFDNVKVKDLINACLTHDDREPSTAEERMQAESDTNMDGNHAEGFEEQQAARDQLSNQLRQTMTRIDEKLASLGKEKEKAQASLQELSAFYTQPVENVESVHKFTLRGISTSPSITYVKRLRLPKEGTEMTDDDFPTEEWWKIAFNAGEPKPIAIYRVTENIVIEAARESDEPLVVYASENSMQPILAPLSEELKQFVERDNQAFKSELTGTVNPKDLLVQHGQNQDSIMEEAPLDELNRVGWEYGGQEPVKRKFDNGHAYRDSPDRRDSMDCNADDDVEEENPVWNEQAGEEFSQEMTERGGGALAILGRRAPGVDEDGDDLMSFEDVMPDVEAAEESAAVKGVSKGVDWKMSDDHDVKW